MAADSVTTPDTPAHGVRRHRRGLRRTGVVGLALGALAAAALTATAAAPAHAATAFTPGDVVVYRVGDGSTSLSGTTSPVYLDEYSPTGTLVQSIPMPTTDAGTEHALTASGSATSEGLLTLSGDGQHLVVPGYDAPVGTKKISGTAAATTPRTVGIVGADGQADTTTALTDWADGNNPRSATSEDGQEVWVGGAAGGVRYAPLGASTSTQLSSSTYKNVRSVSVVDGQLYTSADPTKASLTIATVGSGLPTSGTQDVENLPFNSGTPVPGDPYGYALLTLGTGTTPDTLYEADPTAGAIVKYIKGADGTWTQKGEVLVPDFVEGLTANDDNGVVTLFVSASGADGNGTQGALYTITDDSGFNQMDGTAKQIAAVPASANEAFRGVAFAPGTVIGSGGGAAPGVAPAISATQSALPAALGQTDNATFPFSVGDPDFQASDLTVTATSGDQAIAADAGIAISGTGASRTLSVTPAGTVGRTVITITATDPNGGKTSFGLEYGVSANLTGQLGPDASQLHYYSGAANASGAIDVGDGYAVVADDESNVLRLYNLNSDGPAVKSFDFTSQLPFGTSEVDLESAAREGDVIYWEGSMSNKDDGTLAPERSTVFATRVTGTGASTQLTYLGAYTGLQADLVAWDQANGSGLGKGALGFAAGTASGESGHDSSALNVEGVEFAGPNSATAYLAFRAPLEPSAEPGKAMLVPVTNYAQLALGKATKATFGKPIFFDLGGLGIRDIRSNGNGTFLIAAGTADGSNTEFALYTWDGVAGHAPVKSPTVLPTLPADGTGAWETIVSVPASLSDGSSIRMLQDDGDADFYADGLTSKTNELTDLQKSLGVAITYHAPVATSTSVVTTSTRSGLEQLLSLPQAVVATIAPKQSLAGHAPGGAATIAVKNSAGATVYSTTAPLIDLLGRGDTAFAVPARDLATAGTYTITVSYAGDAWFAPSSASATLKVMSPALSPKQPVHL
ncbi:DUF3616 domain-containing protein [Gryllotalpicola reticulitermitis]|uniref:DUF3616 domain-containing protein n=1 Tax=Gryllotalpicola reticulitermitis TaxID=1184153 RepID=A0ABV8Q5F3_9MICO